jgi:hypothetical protein
MRYLCIYKPSRPEGQPPDQDEFLRMGQLIEEMTKAGVLLGTEGCQPSAKGLRVRRTNGKFTVTDGPFTEAKELIAGFALIKVASKDEAIQWTKKFLDVAGDGESEVRLLHEMEDFADLMPPEAREHEELLRAQMSSKK